MLPSRASSAVEEHAGGSGCQQQRPQRHVPQVPQVTTVHPEAALARAALPGRSSAVKAKARPKGRWASGTPAAGSAASLLIHQPGWQGDTEHWPPHAAHALGAAPLPGH
jgi:hypothetical protein